MASFFRPAHQFYSAPEPNLQGLFRLIDDFDKYSQNGAASQQQRCRRVQVPTFTPKFDMRESETAYELHGELPGISKEHVHIEFTDPQALLIRGKVERTFTAGDASTSGLLENKSSDEVSDAASHAGDDLVVVDHESETASHRATVEDDPEESSSTTAAQATPATTVAETAKPAEEPKAKPTKPQHKYYLVERNIGQFARTFNFPGRIDHESVSASLHNGILTVAVQKAKKHESRRIAIN